MHLYSALLCIAVHPKRFTIMWFMFWAAVSIKPAECGMISGDTLTATCQRDTLPTINQNKKRYHEQSRETFLNTGACVWAWVNVWITVKCCCTSGSEGKRSEWNYSRWSDLLQGVCYRNGSYSGGGILNAEERDTAAEDVCCNTQARFLHSEVDRSDADEIRFPLKAFSSR